MDYFAYSNNNRQQMKIIAFSCPAVLSIINNLILLVVVCQDCNANEVGFVRNRLWYNGIIHLVIASFHFTHGSVDWSIRNDDFV